MKITVVGIGYVGLSLAVLLSRRNRVTALDVDGEKCSLVNRRISPIRDAYTDRYLRQEELDLTATTDAGHALRDADLVIIAVPTDYDPEENYFDTSVVESVLGQVLACNRKCTVVIKSTVPVGYTEAIKKKLGCGRILFSPEFLRESQALRDNLRPSRIIVGCDGDTRPDAETFAGLLRDAALNRPDILIMGNTEAEAVKLFSNTYLALRVSFFNELDTFAESKGLKASEIIAGVCGDPRIGSHYNNPSFGYGGYCLPKDTKQLLANYRDVPQHMISAVVESNRTRKDFIAERILRMAGAGGCSESCRKDIVVGIYRLAMKEGSHNFRRSSILGVMKRIRAQGITVVVFEPSLEDGSMFCGAEVIGDIHAFKQMSRVIVANRVDGQLQDVMDKVYTRDLYHRD